MIYALANTWYLGLLKSPTETEDGDSGQVMSMDAVLNIVSILREWSPAYQFNELVLTVANGSFVDHTYCLMVFTVLVTQSHKFVVEHFYKVEMKL